MRLSPCDAGLFRCMGFHTNSECVKVYQKERRGGDEGQPMVRECGLLQPFTFTLIKTTETLPDRRRNTRQDLHTHSLFL